MNRGRPGREIAIGDRVHHMDDSLLFGRDQAGDRGNVGGGQNLQSVEFEAFFATEGVEDLRGCTNSVLGDDAAAAGRPGASMANLVLNEDAAAAPERRWRGVAAINRRDGAAKCIDCSTVLTFSVKLKVLSVARHRWRSSSNIWSPSARIMFESRWVSSGFVACCPESKRRQRHSLSLKSLASKAQPPYAIDATPLPTDKYPLP